MKPLLLLVCGLVVVVVDFRLGAFDIVPDIVGWVMAVAGLRRLTYRDDSFSVAAAAAGVGAVVGLAQLVPGWTFGELLEIGEGVATTVLVFATCTGIARVAASEPAIARRARNIRAADLVLAVLVLPLTLASRADVLMTAPLLLLVSLATLAVMVWFLWFLSSVRDYEGFQIRPMNAEVA